MRSICIAVLLSACAAGTHAEVLYLSDPALPGLAAEIEFTLLDPTSLRVRITNVSTGVPVGFSNSDQLLTGVSWDFGLPGANLSDPCITGGSVVIGASSYSVNFSTGHYGPGYDVSGEWGFGNAGGSCALANFVTTNTAHAIPFGGPNLDGPVNLSGPQGGLIALPAPVDIGGLGAIQRQIIATLTLSAPLLDLGFLAHGVRVEYGSDAAFLNVPEPATFALLGISLGLLVRKRRGRA